MTSLTAKAILRKKYDASIKKAGTECLFVQLTDNWGVKFYPTPSARDGAMCFQKKAAKVGAGPEVGPKLEFDELFGYLTRIAEVVDPENYYYNKNNPHRHKFLSTEEFVALRDKLHKIGYYIDDFHGGNVGYYKDCPVNIDFGIRESGTIGHFSC